MSTDVTHTNAYDLAVLPVLQYPDKDDSWRDQAHCLGQPMDVFFNGRKTAKAKAICAGCPVSEPCLNFAIRNDLVGGIYGGKTEDERKALACSPSP